MVETMISMQMSMNVLCRLTCVNRIVTILLGVTIVAATQGMSPQEITAAQVSNS